MINFPIKALIGAGVAGVIGLGGYGIYAASKPERTIFDVLQERNLVPLTTDTEWGEKVNSFNSNSQNTDKLEGFEKKTQTSDGDENREAMKNACRKLFSTPLSKETEELKEQVKKWCTKAKSGG